MATGQMSSVVRYLRKVTARQLASSSTDATLLERFVNHRDEAAFEALVNRHGPMVLGLCQRVLGNRHDAEDAFQATFLVLVHKAASVRKQASLCHWLYGVAYRTALQARTELARRRVHERKAATMGICEAVPDLLWQELHAVLDEEVSRLPEKYRAPVVLCYLEGMTYEEASRQLRWPKGTVAIRLARARERLRANLVRRGVVLSGAAMAAAVPASLLNSTVQAAALTIAGRTSLAGILPARVLALSKAVLCGMTMSAVKTTLAVLFTVGAVTVGPGLFLHQALVAKLATPSLESQDAASAQPPAPRGAVDPRPNEAADTSKTHKYNAGPLAHRLWSIMDLVEKAHLDPCSRRDMILAGATALLKAAKATPPTDLERRVAAVAGVKQLESFLEEIWPVAGTEENSKLECALTEGLLKKIPGEPQLLPEAYARVVNQVNNNRYVGIGVQLAINKDEKVPQIMIPFRGGAARKAGALPNDLLVAVDGKDTHNVEMAKIVEWLRGEEGSSVTIVVRQPGATETRTLRLTRAIIRFDTVLGYRRVSDEGWTYRIDSAPAIGYVRVESILASTLHELRKVESQLHAEGCEALVLDFRSSHGQSVLYHATLVADALLDGGIMWGVRDAHGDVKEFKADRECLFRNWPLAVLVDKELADRSQAGIVAALQDNKRAVVVGEPTKCDGYINAILPLPESKDSLVLRTARMERAAKEKTWPLQPDHEVSLTDAQRTAVLAWLQQKQQTDSPTGTNDRPPDDPQLQKAIDILRAALHANGTAASGNR